MNPCIPVANFFNLELQLSWVTHGDIRATIFRAGKDLTLTQMFNIHRPCNYEIEKNPTTTGHLRAFLNELEHQAFASSFQKIAISGIVNDFLPGVLVRRMYVPLERSHSIGHPDHAITKGAYLLREAGHPIFNQRTAGFSHEVSFGG